MSTKMADWQYWILQNLSLLSKRFGKNNVVLDGKTWMSILIVRYTLPSSWRSKTSRLLIVLPPKSQIFYSPPDRFYLEPGLKATNGISPTHYYEGNEFNDLKRLGFSRFSFHLMSGWKPQINATSGTNLEHILAGLHIGLDRAAKEVL